MKNYLAFLFIAVLTCIAGCKTESSAPGLGDDFGTGGTMTCVDRDGDGYGPNCSLGNDCDDTNVAVTNQCYVCAHDQPGCPCSQEGARTGCGKVTARLGDQTTCGYGETTCSNGQWGDCVLDGRSTRSFSSTRRALGLAMATACAEVCDPYCKQFADTPDDSLTNRVGVIGTDGGVTTDYLDGSAPIRPNGPMPTSIKNQLTDAGLYPTAPPETIIYHELTPTSTAQDNINGIAGVKTADVYFVDFNIGHDAAEAQRIWYDMDIVGGTMDQIRAAIPDLYMGVGRYEQYDRSAWNWSGHSTAVYTHLQSLTRDTSAVIDALNWAYFRFYDGGVVKPTSWVDALFAMATTGGLRGSSASSWWVQPRSSWVSPVSGSSGSCPLGRMGYPCFRPTALPITVLFAQGPSNNGPGGQYAYARNSAYGIYGATQWPATSIAVTNNWTQATARAIDPITQFATYTGTTSPGTPNMNWGWTEPAECEFERGRASPNSFFKFHVNERTWYHFDTVGSNFNTVIYMYTAAGVGITCNDRHFVNATPDPMVSSIEGVINPGDYYVVVDGQIGANGNYVMHVNAMPDAPAVSAPNYDETVTALNAIGTKIVSVDSSGYTCRAGPTAFEQRNTGNQLEKLALDTGSVNAAGVPYRVQMDASLGVCRIGDRRVDYQIADAIIGTFNTQATALSDVTAVAVDVDDPIDFDGPPGGSRILTPLNIDDATFVQSITTVPTVETNTYCQQTLANRFVGCRPGTRTTFNVTFKKPANVPALDRDQIFTFALRTLRNGTLVLSETPVVIVVPTPKPVYYTDAWFVRDYDGSLACPKGTAPYWGFFGWNTQTPGDSHVDFEVAVAPSVAELPSAPIDVLRFSNPPGPMALVSQPISAKNPVGGPDTRVGVTIVDSTLALNERPRTSKAMRLRAHLVPSTDRTLPPVLELWNQRISCQPAE